MSSHVLYFICLVDEGCRVPCAQPADACGVIGDLAGVLSVVVPDTKHHGPERSLLPAATFCLGAPVTTLAPGSHRPSPHLSPVTPLPHCCRLRFLPEPLSLQVCVSVYNHLAATTACLEEAFCRPPQFYSVVGASSYLLPCCHQLRNKDLLSGRKACTSRTFKQLCIYEHVSHLVTIRSLERQMLFL